MCCVETQICSPPILDIRTGLDSRFVQRKNPSQSKFLNKQKVRFSTEIRSNHNTDIGITHQCYETSQTEPNRYLKSASLENRLARGIFDHNTVESIQENSTSKIFSPTWNSEFSQIKNKNLSPPPSHDSIQNMSFDPSCSNSSTYMPIGNTGDEMMFKITKSYDLHSLTEPQNLDNQEFSQKKPSCYQDHYISSACFPHTKSYNVYDSSEDDSFTMLDFGQSLMTDSTAYSNTSSTEYSMWENVSLTESPGILPLYDDWNLSPVTNSPVCFSSPIDVSSPKFTEKYLDVIDQSDQSYNDKPGSKLTGIGPCNDLNEVLGISNGLSIEENMISDDSFKKNCHSSIEIEGNAREHPLYHNVSPGEDGLYHCPWENEPGSNCQHRPEKLKCNYDKFVDSHLKPYRCKVLACKDLHFSSTACLLRHEREAHAMHGHGDKPFLCTYEGCERGIHGNGFPRHWNLRDHMKRVHNDSGYPKPNTTSTSNSIIPVKGRKRKANDPSQTTCKKVSTSPDLNRSRELSLIERYKEKQQNLLETVKQLHDPRNFDNIRLLRDANDCLKVMIQTSQRIISGPSMAKQAG